jgi:HrpA-like RNA helicase
MSSNNDLNPFTKKAYSANFFLLRKTAQTLPVSQRIPQLLSRIKQSNVVVVVGETGSGKTTQLPKAILLDGDLKGKKLALTQNRRLAAQLVRLHISDSTVPKELLMFGNTRSPSASQRRWMCMSVALSVLSIEAVT